MSFENTTLPFPTSGDRLEQLRAQAAEIKNERDRALALRLCAMFDQLRRRAEEDGLDVEIVDRGPAIILPFPKPANEARSSVRVPVRFSAEERRKLRQIATKNSQTPAGLIRLAVAQLLEQVEARRYGRSLCCRNDRGKDF